MEERYNYIITWSSETGWEINDEMGKELFTKGFIQVKGGKVESEEEAEEVLARYEAANIGEHLHARDQKLREMIATMINDMEAYMNHMDGLV